MRFWSVEIPKLISEGKEIWFQLFEVLAGSERRTTSCVLGLANQIFIPHAGDGVRENLPHPQ